MKKVLFLFGQLNESDVEFLSDIGRKQVVPAGETLIQQGKPVDAVYVVLSGRLAVSVGGQSPRVLAEISCGEVVGEMSFLDARPPAATVKATERAVVLAVPRARLASRLREDASFAARFYHALGILLAYRLRNHDLGYSAGMTLSEEATYDDELDEDVLDHLALAGKRFDLLLRRLGA